LAEFDGIRDFKNQNDHVTHFGRLFLYYFFVIFTLGLTYQSSHPPKTYALRIADERQAVCNVACTGSVDLANRRAWFVKKQADAQVFDSETFAS
jgi:hypothetical protein